MTGRRRKSGLATSVCIGLILLLFGDSGGNTDARGGPSSLTLDRTIEGNQLFANGIPNESDKVPLEVRPSNAENEETRQRLLRTPRKTKQEEEQEERRRVEAQSEEDEGGIDGDNGDENGGEDYNLDTSSDSNASDIRSHEDTAEEVEDKRVKDLDRKADESEKGSKERDNHDGRSLDDARSSNAKSKFGEVRSADSAGKSSSAKAITEDFIRLSRNNGLNTVTEKPSSTSPSSSVDEEASKREDKRSSREETTVEAHSVETTTKSDVTGPTNGKLNDNLEIRKNLEVADLESASLPKARDRTEDGISLINDTRVNYNHYYKTLTESDGDGSDLLHRKKAVGPKQEVEIVSNASHPAILRIEARNDTDSINGTASERNFVANENELYQANEENRHVGLGEAADQEGKTPASSTIVNDHDGKAIVSSTSTSYPADQGQLTTERGVNSSLVAKGRTIALSDVNEFPDVETKTTTDGTKPREFDRKDFSERRPPYPYVKSSRDPSSTESSSTTTLPSGTMDKAKEDEASAYENTINTGQSENKFVVTEASVVLENSIQQSRPNDRRSSEETSSSNRTSEPPAPSRSLSSTSVGDNDDSDDRVSSADVAPTRHTHVADSRASDVDLSWNSTRIANVDNEVVRGNSGNGSRSNEQHGFDVSNAITETSSITIEPLPGDTTIAYRQSSISGAVGSTSTGVPPTEDHRIDETVEVSRDVQTNAEESMLLKESTLNVTEASVEYPSVIGENFDEVRQSNAKKDISISSTIASLESLAETTASKVVDTAIATNGSSSPAVTAESSTTDTALVSESLESNPSDEAIKATTMASTGVEYEFVGLTDATTTTTTTTTRNSSKALDFFVESSSTTESENNTEEIPLTVKEISASTSLTTTVQEASTEAIKDSMSNVESQPVTVSLRDSTETEMPTISDTTMLPSMSVANETTTTTTATTTRPITSTESTDVDSTLMRTTTENEDGVNNGTKNVDGEVNASTTNRNDDLRNATTSNRSSVEPFARHNSAFVDETTTFLTRSTVSPAFSSTARPGFSVPSTVATKRASTGVWSSATSSNVVTGPPNEEGIKIFSADKITSMIKMDIEGTCQEVCPHLDTLRQCLAELLTNKKNKRVSEKQIKFHQNPCLDESILATSSSGGPIFSILLYVVDENDKFDNAMTKILPSLFKDNDVKFPLTVHSFLLVPEMDSGNAIAAVIVSSVACICLVLLAGLLFIMRKRQTRFNYGERCRPVSLDAYSLDSVSAYNSVRRKGVVRSSKRSYGNPTFEDSSAIPSHPLNFAGLSSFCGDVNAINEEFSGIPQVTAKIDELPPGAEIKNRYANVIPLPETRVPLQRINSDPITEYINASYVRGPKNATKYYIACQAPLESTITDFWRMIWEQQCKVIIMLTDLFENGVEKCSEYIPPSEVTDCHRLYGDFQVTLKKRETKEKYAISTLLFKNLENNTFREVYHIWYLWPTSGVQSDGAGLIAVLLEARALQRGGPGPIVVHCSPGTGRTGTLIALDLGIRQYEITRTVDVPRVVYTIRRDRAGAVQTKEQYAFIYKALNLYATKLAGGVLEST